MGRKTVGAITVGALLVGLGVVQLLPEGSSPLASRPASATELRPYQGCEPLLESFRETLARQASPYGRPVPFGGTSGGSTTGFAAQAPVPLPAFGAADSLGGAVGTGPSGTNVQERGVEEPDIVKLSDGNLVTIAAGALQIVSTTAVPRLVGRLPIPAEANQNGFYGGLFHGGPREVLVDGDWALVVDRGMRYLPTATVSGSPGEAGSTGSDPIVPIPPAVPAPPVRPFAPVPGPGSYGIPTTVLRLADLSDPAAPTWLETYEVDGSYLSARLVNGTVRLVTQSTPRPTPVQITGPHPTDAAGWQARQRRLLQANREAARALTLAQVLPQATLSASGTDAALSCQDVSFAPGAAGSSLVLVSTFRPSVSLRPLDSTAVQADGQIVYATADRLFVATSRWGSRAATLRSAGDQEVTTEVHAFDTTDPDQVRYVGSGSVTGYIYGRWALSWHAGALRIATTTQPPSRGPSRGQSESSMVVLRESAGGLREVGRVDGLGKGEVIQAVRYFGDLATVVTFRRTDPLYVLDLSDPTAPRVTGELKVTGFSSYLHPIGDDRLLGIGMEADPRTGRTTGVQVSTFDLSEASNPVQLDRLQLGRGHSVALQDSRAFGYDPASRLAVLPLQTYSRGGPSSYGLGLRVHPDGHLSEVGRLQVDAQTFLSRPGTEILVPGYAPVQRVVLDGDRVHLLTPASLISASAATFRQTGSLIFR